MSKRSYTSKVSKKINEIFSEFKSGKIDKETFVETVMTVGKRVWNAFVAEFKRTFHPYMDGIDEELWEIIRSTVWETATKASEDGNYFSYLRKYVKGNLYTFARTMCFPVTLKSFPFPMETEFVPIDMFSDPSSDYEEETDGTGDGIPLSDIIDPSSLDPFEEMEIRDVIEKTLDETGRRIVYLLMDGYNLDEVSEITQIPLPKLKRKLSRIRRLLRQVLRS